MPHALFEFEIYELVLNLAHERAKTHLSLWDSWKLGLKILSPLQVIRDIKVCAVSFHNVS